MPWRRSIELENWGMNEKALQLESYRLAMTLTQLASRPDATPIEKEARETAAYIIAIAERKAKKVPVEWANADLGAFRRRCEEIFLTLESQVESVSDTGQDTAASQVTANDELTREIHRLIQSLQLSEWDAWSEAYTRLNDLRASLDQGGTSGE